jgi:hypothetical protein
MGVDADLQILLSRRRHLPNSLHRSFVQGQPPGDENGRFGLDRG